jgi:uncharacterized protein
MLSNNQIQALEDILFDETQESTLFDYFSLHGLVCACIVSPKKYSENNIFEIIFEDTPSHFDEEQESIVKSILSKLINKITQDLLKGDSVAIPLADDEAHEEEAINHWCIGFIEGFLLDEDSWFEHQPDVVAELLLPYMVLSDLFDDEDFIEIKKNEVLIDQFYENLSDILTDLYLFYHAT